MTSLRRRFSRFIELRFGIAVLLLAGFFYVAYQQIQAFSSASYQANHAQVVRLELAQLLTQVQETATMQRKFLTARDPAYLVGQPQRIASLDSTLRRISVLIGQNAIQQQNLSVLTEHVHKRINLLDTTTGTDSLSISTRIAATDSIWIQAKKMDQLEEAVLAKHESVQSQALRLAPTLTWIVILVVFTLLIFSYINTKSDLRLLQRQYQLNLENTAKITELNRALEDRNLFTETLLDNLTDAVTAFDTKLNFLAFNRSSEAISGRDRKDVLGQDIRLIFPEFAKDTDRLGKLERALRGETMVFSQHSALNKDMLIDYSFIPLRHADGTIFGVLSIAHDVTEHYQLRRQLEERTRFAEMLIDSSVDMITAHDTNLRYTVWNKSSADHFHLAKEDVLGKNLFDVFPQMRGQEVSAAMYRVLEGETIHLPPRKAVLTDDYYETYLLPLRDEKQGISGALSITHNVTESYQLRRQLEERNHSLEESNRQLANTNAELASFSYVASHDLQEPLRKIQSFGSRILTTEGNRLSETGLDAFRRMQAAAERMQQLIEDLLAYSRTNTQSGDFELVDLNEMLQDAWQEVGETTQERQAVLQADPLPLVRAVAFQFRQLFTNLFSNAVKYQQPGQTPHVRITCKTVPGSQVPQPDAQAAFYFQIDVTDNGIGFDPQYAERIFELFQRLHGRSEYKGTGIGLAICRKIVQNHHGFLLAEGRPGEGATFTIYLPSMKYEV